MGSSILDPEGSTLFLFFLAQVTTSVSYYVINAGILVLLLLLSSLVSGSETAFFSLSAQQIEALAESDKKRDKLIARLLRKPKRLLANILIFNNLVNIAIVTLSTFVMWTFFGTDHPTGIIVAVTTSIITLSIVLFGEVIPKIYANQKNIEFARVTIYILNFADTLFTPVAFLLMKISNLVERRVEKKGYHISVDDLNHALDITTENESTAEEREILKGIVNFGTITVKQVMRSRVDITAFDEKMDFHQAMDKINKSGYSRLPVYKDTIDKITGILYIKDLLQYIDEDEDFKWQHLLHSPFFVPESKKINDLLKNFQERRVHMAIVVDEYGGTSGLVTLEDIIEEIVGEINDEFDDEEIEYTKLDKNTYVFEGKTSLTDTIKILDEKSDIFDPAKGESESLGGMLLELNEGMPKTGDKITFDKFEFLVESVSSKRIKRVRLTVNEEEHKEFED